MNCPRCSKPLNPADYERVDVDVCGGCKGVWLDEGEILRIIDTHEVKIAPELVREVIAHAFSGLPPAKVKDARTAGCPKCGKVMTLLNYGYDSGVIIDRCASAHGIWLDAGELEKIQAFREKWEEEAPKHKANWVGLLNDLKTKPELKPAAEVAKRLDHSTFMFRQFLNVFMK
ncbi:MAG: zf-TFIIB domain-containing protein [Bdellovibrionales bacterium]|nr:zf-TFIIB domain-containing protein [Bdellovibrionales bacterium]